MKKFLKILALAAVAVAAAIACVFAGCNKGGDSGDASSDYNFTIVYEGGEKNGQAVNGQTDGSVNGKVATQICLPASAGGTCIPLTQANIFPDANGKLSLSQAKVNELFSTVTGSSDDVTVFIFHVIGVTGYKNDCEVEVNNKGDYTVKVTVS